MVGTGVLLAAAPGAPAPTTAEVKLASTEIPLGPLDCLFNPASCGGLIGSAGSPTPTALAAASPSPFGIFGNLRPIIGPGGWLIGDGLDALEIDPTCTSLCQGGNGGLLGGSGGAGAFGGAGGNAGLFWGNGGDGGAGINAVYDTFGGQIEAPTEGGNGGRASFLIDNGGDGGSGGWDDNPDVVAPGATAADGGDGGRCGWFWGDGGFGGEGGSAITGVGDAVGGAGGGGTSGPPR